jgi:hypothetical protein
MGMHETLLFGLDKLDMLLRMATKDFADGQWTTRHGGLHSAHWILAHLVLSIQQEAGKEIVFSPELDKSLDYGAPQDEQTQDWPAVEDLWAMWEEGRHALAALWRSRDPEAWSAPVPENSLGMSTVADGAMFVLEHAVYHVGQLGALRRVEGLKGVV